MDSARSKVRQTAQAIALLLITTVIIIISGCVSYTPLQPVDSTSWHDPNERQSVYGSQSHFGMGGGLPKFADKLKESGSEITRVWIWWEKIEPINDQYNWAEMDEFVKSANDRNIEVLGYFAFMPAWAKNKENPKCRDGLPPQRIPLPILELKTV